MLIEFKVANYRSIREEQTLSMIASNYSDELPQNLISCDHVPGMKGIKLVKAVALYGANASGKSNIVAALRFFAEFVRDSATKLQPGAPTGAQPFKLDPACLDKPSKFEITAVINGIRTLYGLELTRERVTSEYLVAYPKGRPQVWFERDWEEKTGTYEWSKSTAHFKHDDALHEKTRENAAFISAAAQFAHGQAQDVVAGICQKIAFADPGRSHANNWMPGLFLADSRTKDEFSALLLRADIGVKAARSRKAQQVEAWAEALGFAPSADGISIPGAIGDLFNRTKDEKMRAVVDETLNQLSVPELLHKGTNDSEVAFDYYAEESLGTRRFIALVAELLSAHYGKAVLVADELEISLHPLLVMELIELFQSGGFPSAIQLLFTTHNPLLLDQTLLRRDQIWFTEKDQEGATRLYPLTDFKPRKDESLVKGYLAGRYGGIPFIPEGLKF